MYFFVFDFIMPLPDEFPAGAHAHAIRCDTNARRTAVDESQLAAPERRGSLDCRFLSNRLPRAVIARDGRQR